MFHNQIPLMRKKHALDQDFIQIDLSHVLLEISVKRLFAVGMAGML